MKLIPLLYLVTFLSCTEIYSQQCDYHNACDSMEIHHSFRSSSIIPMNVIRVIPSPCYGTSSLAFDGTDLWVGAYPDSIFKVSRVDGTVLKRLYTGLNRPYGLAFVNGCLWIADNGTGTINKVDTSNGNIIFSFNSFGQGYEAGMAWDGHYLWHIDQVMGKMYIFDTTGALINQHIINNPIPIGMTFQNNFLWIGDNGVHKLYKVDSTSFNIIDSMMSPRQFPNGLAYDGQYLWVAENENSMGFDSIYMLGFESSLGVEQQMADAEVDIFPNPSRGTITINSQHNPEEVWIENPRGQLICHRKLTNNFIDFNANDGIYFLKVKIGDQYIIKKISIIH